MLDIAAPVDQDADLAPDIRRELGHCAREVIRDEAVGLEAPSTESLEGFRLIGLEAARVSVNLNRDGVYSDALMARSLARVGEAAASGQTGRANPALGFPEGRCRSPGIELWGARCGGPDRPSAILSEMRAYCRVVAIPGCLQDGPPVCRS